MKPGSALSRGLYFGLVLVRLYFALSPSYIHPDEHLQGPEVLTGDFFHWQVDPPWEFVSAKPIRSIFPLWVIYGVPLSLIRTLNGSHVDAITVFRGLRLAFFLFSFANDWAVYTLAQPMFRHTALLLYASSYVTWTFQTHTFSNAIETILVCLTVMAFFEFRRGNTLWSLSGILAGVLTSFGFFLRITFPAFVLPAALAALPPARVIAPAIAFAVVSASAIYFDTAYYSHGKDLASNITITPLNNLLYNSSNRNLATHGLHPLYTHLIVNIPCLLGPGFFLPYLSQHLNIRCVVRLLSRDLVFLCAVSGILLLSAKPHQEARFLLPVVPLLLTSFSQFYTRGGSRIWLGLWIIFNTVAGIFMGSYHQCGVVPSIEYLSNRIHAPRPAFCGNTTDLALAMPQVTKVIWWRTYTCPKWMFGHTATDRRILQIVDLGGSIEALEDELTRSVSLSFKNATADVNGSCEAWAEHDGKLERTFLVAPRSALTLENFISHDTYSEVRLSGNILFPLTVLHHHVNLDDVDIRSDSIAEIARRVSQQHGLGIFLLGSTHATPL